MNVATTPAERVAAWLEGQYDEENGITYSNGVYLNNSDLRALLADLAHTKESANIAMAILEQERDSLLARLKATVQPEAVAEWVNEEQGFQYLIPGRLPDGTKLGRIVEAPPATAPTNWKERLYSAMDDAFGNYSSGQDDKRMRTDDTQVGVEFAMQWFEKNLLPATTAQPVAVAQDEREAFEAWYRRINPQISDWRCTENLGKDADGLYFMHPVPRLWAAWQARASLPLQPVAVPEGKK